MSPDHDKKYRSYEYWSANPFGQIDALTESDGNMESLIPTYLMQAIKASLCHPNSGYTGKKIWEAIADLGCESDPERYFFRRKDFGCPQQGFNPVRTMVGGVVYVSDQVEFPIVDKKQEGLSQNRGIVYLEQAVKHHTDRGTAVYLFLVNDGKPCDVVKWREWLVNNKMLKAIPRRHHLYIAGEEREVVLIPTRRRVVGKPGESDIFQSEYGYPLREVGKQIKGLSGDGFRVDLSGWTEVGKQSERHYITYGKMLQGAGLVISATRCGCVWEYDRQGRVIHSPCGDSESCQGEPKLLTVIDHAVKSGWADSFRESKDKEVITPTKTNNAPTRRELSITSVPEYVVDCEIPGLIGKGKKSPVLADLEEFCRTNGLVFNELTIRPYERKSFKHPLIPLRLTSRIVEAKSIMPEQSARQIALGEVFRANPNKQEGCRCRYVCVAVNYGDESHPSMQKSLVRYHVCQACLTKGVNPST